MKRKTILFFSSLLFIAGCSILGVHFKIHNPSRAGKYPKKTEARVLFGNQESKYRTCYDVNEYDLSIKFGSNLKKDQSISGSVEIKSKARTEIDTLQIDLAKQFLISKINVVEFDFDKFKSIHLEYANYFRKGNAVFVIMPHHLSTGAYFSMMIYYSGIPTEAKRPPWSGGFVRKEDKLKNPWWGVACETEGASSWWPCKDVTNDEPESVNVSLCVPDGLMAVSNGKLVSEKKFDNETEYHWHVSNPINIYDITFYIGNYKLLHDTYYSEVTHDTLQLNHYVLEQNYEIAKTHFQQLKKYLAFYEKTFGPYPWYNDGFKLVESPYEGMEHQSAIAYGAGYKNDRINGFDYIILHETAHEWWGNSVTANDLADGWIHEGFATYAEALYVESTKGHEAYLNYLLQCRLFIVNRRPICGEQGIRYFNYKDGDIYMKGAWVLHTLRTVVGDSMFFDILKSFRMENNMKTVSSLDFENFVSKKVGKDMSWFFQQYLHNRFTPELEYCIKGKTLFYRWNPNCSDTSFNRMVVSASGYSGEWDWSIDPNGLTPSTMVNQCPFNENAKVYFDDRSELFKKVENKNLPKEYIRNLPLIEGKSSKKYDHKNYKRKK